MGLNFDISDMLNGITETESKLDIAVGILCETAAKNLEGDSKEQG